MRGLRQMTHMAALEPKHSGTVTGSGNKIEEEATSMVRSNEVKTTSVFSRVTFFALLMITMVAATLHLGSFTAEAGQAGLSWSAPTTNTNGTPVTGLSGYKIYVGNASRSYQQNIDVGKLTNYNVANLTDGATYYFAVTAYNSAGQESAYSNEASKTLPAATATYTITATSGAGGSIAALNNTKLNTATTGTTTITSVTVAGGASQSFSIAPAAGYATSDVKVDGTSVGAVASYSFASVKADHTIQASFAAQSGTGTGTTVAINAGGSQLSAAGVAYQADVNYSGGSEGNIGSVAINGTTDDALYQTERWGASSYNIPLANGNYNLTLKFAETYWNAAGKRIFDVSVGGQTVISNLDIFAKAGQNTAYDVVVPVTVTNGSLAIKFVNKVDNAKICAMLVAPGSQASSNSITASAGTGGSITPSGAATVSSGTSKTYAIAAATGYSIADVKVDGVSVGKVASYTFSNVTANHTIAASFTVQSYSITASAGTGGSITPSGAATVSSGASKSYAIAAATGYSISDVKVDGVSAGKVASYTFSNVTANHTIQASFTAAATAGKLVFATSSGGAQFTDASGVGYQADAYYSGGNAGNIGTVAINGTTDDSLYQTERWGASSYSIPMTNGNYNLTLKFAETYWSAAGKRLFDVSVGGVTMISNLDIFAKAGKNAAYDVVVPVSVTNGTLSIKFVNKVDNAKICAIKITTR